MQLPLIISMLSFATAASTLNGNIFTQNGMKYRVEKHPISFYRQSSSDAETIQSTGIFLAPSHERGAPSLLVKKIPITSVNSCFGICAEDVDYRLLTEVRCEVEALRRVGQGTGDVVIVSDEIAIIAMSEYRRVSLEANETGLIQI